MSRRIAGIVVNIVGTGVIVLGLATAASAAASPAVELTAGLRPEKLGKVSTVSIGFKLPTESGGTPKPLAEFDIQLPAEMGLGGTTLGVNTCSAETLISDGPSECPEDAIMGYGSAAVDAYLGSQIVSEPANVTLFMGQAAHDRTTLLYYFDGKSPVIAPIVFSSAFLAVGNSPVSELRTTVPAISGLPGTPDASITTMIANIGGNLVYHKVVDHHTVAYKPTGMTVPSHCPRGGFRFSGYFRFEDGTRATATRNVPCPR